MSLLMLTFDPSRIASNSIAVDGFLENHRDVKGWSSPFPGVYFVKSDKGAKEFARSLDTFFSKRGFFVAAITGDKNGINGRAIPEVWDFINEDVSKKIEEGE